MTHDRATLRTTTTDRRMTDRRTRLDAAGRLCVAAAVVAGLFAAGFLVQWGNRFYILQAFGPGDSATTVEDAQYSYHLLGSAHEALLSAVVSLLVVGAALAVRAWLRSSDGPRASIL